MHLLGELLGWFGTGPVEERSAARLEALDCFRRTGDDLGAATQLHHLYGENLQSRSRLAEAEGISSQAIALAEPLGDEVFLFMFMMDRAVLLLITGKPAEATPLVRRCLLVIRRLGLLFAVGEELMAAACVGRLSRSARAAARLHGAADTAIAREIAEHTIAWSDAEQDLRQRTQDKLRMLLGELEYQDAYQAGAGLPTIDAVALALRQV